MISSKNQLQYLKNDSSLSYLSSITWLKIHSFNNRVKNN